MVLSLARINLVEGSKRFFRTPTPSCGLSDGIETPLLVVVGYSIRGLIAHGAEGETGSLVACFFLALVQRLLTR